MKNESFKSSSSSPEYNHCPSLFGSGAPILPPRSGFAALYTDIVSKRQYLWDGSAWSLLTAAAAGGGASLLHSNAAQVVVNGLQGQATLLDGAVNLAANSLAVGDVILIEAFGSFSDPGANSPGVTLTLKLNDSETWLWLNSGAANSGENWCLRGLITVRSIGVTGAIEAGLAMLRDVNATPVVPFGPQGGNFNTTGALVLNLLASIDNYTGGELVTCDLLAITKFSRT